MIKLALFHNFPLNNIQEWLLTISQISVKNIYCPELPQQILKQSLQKKAEILQKWEKYGVVFYSFTI